MGAGPGPIISPSPLGGEGWGEGCPMACGCFEKHSFHRMYTKHLKLIGLKKKESAAHGQACIAMDR